MALRETVKTLRIYFIFSGLVSATHNLSFLASSTGVTLLTLIGVVDLLFALAVLYFGISLKRLLAVSPGIVTSTLLARVVWVGLLLVAGLIYGAVHGAAGLQLMGATVSGGAGLLLWVLLVWYLLKNVKRLAAEQKAVGAAPNEIAPGQG